MVLIGNIAKALRLFTLSVSINTASTLTLQINLGLQPISESLTWRIKKIYKQLIGAILLAALQTQF